MLKLSNYKRLWAVLIVGVIALILNFGLQQALWAQIVVTILGSLIALLMLVDMVKTLRSGKFGVDLLAITAVVATLAIGEYWALDRLIDADRWGCAGRLCCAQGQLRFAGAVGEITSTSAFDERGCCDGDSG